MSCNRSRTGRRASRPLRNISAKWSRSLRHQRGNLAANRPEAAAKCQPRMVYLRSFTPDSELTFSVQDGECPCGETKGFPLLLKLVTCQPLAIAFLTTAEPTKPFPPITRICMVRLDSWTRVSLRSYWRAERADEMSNCVSECGEEASLRQARR